MKKFCIFLILSLLLAGPMFAQHFYIGVNGAVNSTWITNVKNDSMPDMNYKSTIHPSFGLNIGYQFNEHLALVLMPGYGILGQKLEDSYTSDTIIAKSTTNPNEFARDIKLTYFQIPLLFKYTVGGQVTKFFVAVGPQFNMLMSAKQTFTKNGSTWHEQFLNRTSGKIEYRDTEDIKDHYNSMDIQARLDFGLEFMVAKKLMIDAGLNLGYSLMDINASDWKVTKKASESYTASHNLVGGFTVGVNYVF